jgi:hypothetical protein
MFMLYLLYRQGMDCPRTHWIGGRLGFSQPWHVGGGLFKNILELSAWNNQGVSPDLSHPVLYVTHTRDISWVYTLTVAVKMWRHFEMEERMLSKAATVISFMLIVYFVLILLLISRPEMMVRIS